MVKHTLRGKIGRQMRRLVDHFFVPRRSLVTIKDYELYLNRFLTFLAHKHIFLLYQPFLNVLFCFFFYNRKQPSQYSELQIYDVNMVAEPVEATILNLKSYNPEYNQFIAMNKNYKFFVF